MVKEIIATEDWRRLLEEGEENAEIQEPTAGGNLNIFNSHEKATTTSTPTMTDQWIEDTSANLPTLVPADRKKSKAFLYQLDPSTIEDKSFKKKVMKAIKSFNYRQKAKNCSSCANIAANPELNSALTLFFQKPTANVADNIHEILKEIVKKSSRSD